MKLNNIKVGDINWDYAREVVKGQNRLKWYEEFDEAEGDFLGWRRWPSHNTVSFMEFKRWYVKHLRDNRSLGKGLKKGLTKKK
tara:strand:+ start:574 stop:822 length:249 start_codon:yes stop_codon:yes gene_type:complete